VTRILLDENVPRPPAREFPDHFVQTVRQAGWEGLKNGALLKAAAGQFDLLITLDKNIP
jgi:hypothetical protein